MKSIFLSLGSVDGRVGNGRSGGGRRLGFRGCFGSLTFFFPPSVEVVVDTAKTNTSVFHLGGTSIKVSHASCFSLVLALPSGVSLFLQRFTFAVSHLGSSDLAFIYFNFLLSKNQN